MDPTACYRRFADALHSGDVREAAEAAEDLAGWLKRGGFLPEQMRCHDRHQAAACLATTSKMLNLVLLTQQA